MTTILKSIIKLNPDAQVTVLDNDIDRIKWSDGNPTNITKEQILAKQTELETEIANAEADAITKKASGKQKLLDLGLSEEEVKALIGI
jgi:hypothetical protein